MRFIDRADAGRHLAERLEHLRSENPVVLGLPRGGVPVAYEIAQVLEAPLDVILVRKLGVPFHRELGFGAIGEGGVRVVRGDIVRMSHVDETDLAEVERTEQVELARRAERFRGGRPRASLASRTAIVVDDGIATGATASAACRVARAQGAARVVLAVPVAPPDAVATLRPEVDELVCLTTPEVFFAVGEWYRDFTQTEDAEVVDLLRRGAAFGGQAPEAASGSAAAADPSAGADPSAAAADPPSGADPPSAAADPTGGDANRSPTGAGPSPGGAAASAGGAGPAAGRTGAPAPVELPVENGTVRLPGDLTMPPGAPAVVAFAHGSGSSRLSPRNRAVAAALNEAGLGTLLFDLLTPDEELDRSNVFAIEPLARRLADVTRWLRREQVPICYFGASTGAAAALWAAADLAAEDAAGAGGAGAGAAGPGGATTAGGGAAADGPAVAAVVSRGGRPDLAGARLAGVRAPTLLIVGGHDETVLDLNRQAAARLRCEHRLAIVPGATHLFEEPGALAAVSELARDWFAAHLAPSGGVRRAG
ncbi:phosphoribosyltransferase family protein [Streptomyces sp. URMC 123]|uniref:phosphoribosyltransferase family protein n=1 Tax=Streptomyces sp. URMC 123 TaxID=3423403 RepID=UPI003F1AD2DD